MSQFPSNGTWWRNREQNAEARDDLATCPSCGDLSHVRFLECQSCGAWLTQLTRSTRRRYHRQMRRPMYAALTKREAVQSTRERGA